MARSLEGMHQSSQLVVNGAVHEHFLTFLKPSFSAVSSSMMIYLDELAHLINKKHGTTREPGEQRLESSFINRSWSVKELTIRFQQLV